MDLTQQEWIEQFNSTENAVILDVRTAQEFADGHIADAINYDIYLGDAFIEAIDALDKSKTYFVYCRSGARSANACGIMNHLGFENAYNLMGGILAWEGDVVTE